MSAPRDTRPFYENSSESLLSNSCHAHCSYWHYSRGKALLVLMYMDFAAASSSVGRISTIGLQSLFFWECVGACSKERSIIFHWTSASPSPHIRQGAGKNFRHDAGIAPVLKVLVNNAFPTIAHGKYGTLTPNSTCIENSGKNYSLRKQFAVAVFS